MGTASLLGDKSRHQLQNGSDDDIDFERAEW